MHEERRQELFGLHIDPLTMDEVVDRCQEALVTRRPLEVGVVNAAKVVKVRHDEELRSALVECDLILADGQSVVWASRILHRPVPERVAGIDLFERLLELAAREQHSVFLLGARPDVVQRLAVRLTVRYPGLRLVGVRDGYFAAEESAAVAEQIRASGADMLFLGMTSPRKEIFIRDHGHDLGVPVLHGVGGSFDVLAGVTRRAPVLWQRTGFEWLYRLLQEPRRLFGRYLVTNTAFSALVVRELLHPSPAYAAASPKAHVERHVIDLDRAVAERTA